jgi:hypothetical protein
MACGRAGSISRGKDVPFIHLPASDAAWTAFAGEDVSGGDILRVSTNDKRLARAEALFKKQEQQREGAKAMAEYQAQREAVRERTARLRALRLARDAARPAPAKASVQ